MIIPRMTIMDKKIRKGSEPQTPNFKWLTQPIWNYSCKTTLLDDQTLSIAAYYIRRF